MEYFTIYQLILMIGIGLETFAFAAFHFPFSSSIICLPLCLFNTGQLTRHISTQDITSLVNKYSSVTA